MKKILVALVIFTLICFISFPIYAEDELEEDSSSEVYVTEDTTLWEIVEETNPDHGEIPDEVKENLENQMVEESDLHVDFLFPLNYVQLCIIIFAVISIVLVLKL